MSDAVRRADAELEHIDEVLGDVEPAPAGEVPEGFEAWVRGRIKERGKPSEGS